MTTHPLTVVPAKAGTQYPPSAQNSCDGEYWMPALAGMTMVGGRPRGKLDVKVRAGAFLGLSAIQAFSRVGVHVDAGSSPGMTRERGCPR